MFKIIKDRFSKRKKLAKKQPEILRYEELEQRVLFSADVVPGLDTVAVEEQVIVQDVASEPPVEREAAPETVEQTAEEARSELVLVNENVTDYDKLIADLQGSDNNRVIEVVVLESDRDGIEQVNDILSERSDLAAVHFITHGADGQINLGDTWLDSTTLQQNRDAVAGWGSALAETGDILFYGCNIAADSDGQGLLDNIADLTGADVAASDDPTGNVSSGGDWDIEYRIGTVGTDDAIGDGEAESWSGLLAVNQAPVNTVPVAQTTAQDTLLEFSTNNGNAISISDADAGSNEIEVTLSVDNGTLSLNSFGPDGGETLVNTPSAVGQYSPTIAANASGSYVAVWASDDADGQGIFGQRYDASGTPVGTEFQINSTTADTQGSPDVAMADDGRFVVVWESYDQDKNNSWGIYGQRFDASGNTVGGEFRVSSTTNGDQQHAAVAMSGGGSFVVVWDGGGAGDSFGVFAQRYNATGVAQGGELLVNTTTTDNQLWPDVAMNDSGDFAVSWQSNLQDGSGTGIYLRAIDATGTPTSAEVQANTTTTGNQTYSSVGIDDAGNVTAVWESGPFGATNVFGRQFDASLNPVDNEFQVNTYTVDDQTSPSLAMTGDGSFVVAWTSNLQDGNLRGVYAQRYDATGNAVGDEFQVSSTSTGNQWRPSAAVTDSGFLVGWEGAGTGDSDGIFLQRYRTGVDDPTITFSGTVAEVNLALDGLTYTPNTGYNGIDTLTITTDDQGNTGTGGALTDSDTVDITVGNANAPVIDLNGADGTTSNYTATWSEGSGPVAVVDSDATLIDTDENLTSLAVTITNLLNGTAEVLDADVSGTSIAKSYNSATGVLTLSGTDSAVAYQQVLRTVTYNNTSDNPDTTARVITFTATDALSAGNTATTTLMLAAANDAPVNTVPGAQSTAQDTSLEFSSGNANAISVGDVDANDGTLQVTLSVNNGTLTLNPVTPFGSDVLANPTTTDSQLNTDVAMSADGSWISVWQSNLQDGSGWGIYAQVYDSDGTPVGSEIQANTVTSAQQTMPAVAVDSSGNFIVTWQSSGQDPGNTWSIYAQRFDSLGNPVGNEFQVNSTTANDQTTPDIAMDGSGNFVIVWEGDGSGDADGVFGRRYDNAGNPLGTEFLINTHTTDDQSDPRVAMDDSGNFVVVWRSNLQDGDSYGVYGQRFNAAGTPQGAEFRINETTEAIQWAPDVAMDADGDFAVTWADENLGLMARVYNAAGTPQTSEFDTGIGPTDIGNAQPPAIEMDASGNFVVARESGGEILARSFDVSGTARSDVFQVNSVSPGIQPNPAIGMNANGDFIVSWDGTGTGDSSGVFAQRYSAPSLSFSTGDGITDSTVTFSGTLADINAALEGLVYTPDGGFNGTDTLTITTNDQGNSGTGGALQEIDTVDITVGNANAPVIDLNGGDGTGNDFATNWAEEGGAVAVVDTDATLIDSDENLTSIAVTITNLLDGANEVLSANAGATSLAVNYNSGVGVLTISGAGTAAQYQQVLRTVTYNNTSVEPDTTARIITFTPTDASSNGNTATTTLTMSATNDAPVNNVPGAQTTPQDTDLVFSSGGGNPITVSDVDAAATEVQVTLSVNNGTLTLNQGITPVGVETQGNTETASSQYEPDIAYAADGSYAVVWTSSLQDGDSGGIYYQRYDANGNTVGGEVQVNTTTAQNQESPMIAMDDAGNAVIVWESFDQDWNNTWGMIGQRFDAAGNKVGNEFITTPTVTSDQNRGDVAMDAAGNFMVVWTYNSNEEIRMQRYAADGTALGSETTVSSWSGIKVDPRVAMDDAGNAIVVWYTNGQDGDGMGVYGQRVDALGNLVGPEFRVNTETVSSQDDPAVAMDADGDFVVVWASLSQDGDSSGVYGQRYNAAGVAQGSEFQVNETTADSQGLPDVTMDADGNFTVVWRSNLQDGSGTGVYARQYAAEGTALTSEFLVNTTTSGNQSTPSIAMAPGGDFTVAWAGEGATDTSGISLQRFQVGGSATFSVGDGTDDSTMTFTGTVAEINTVLDGLIYTPNNGFNGVDTLTITTDDQGNTGSGGAQSDIDTVNITIGTGNVAPTLSLPGGAVNYTENDPPTVIDATATVSDPDSANFDTGTLTIDFSANGTANDRLAIRDQGTGIGNIQVSGNNISYQPGGSSILIGTYTGGTDGSTPLVVTLNAAADTTAVQALLRNITYENVSENPNTSARTVRFVLTDGDGGTSTAVTETINMAAVNDDPTDEGSLPIDLVFLEDMQGKLNLSAIDLSDVDAGSGNLTLTITSANGHLQTLGWPGLTLGGSQSELILTGNLTDLNDFLNDTDSIDYEHATPNISGDNVDLITIKITDNGNTGSGGGETITLGTINIDVTAANDPPVITSDGGGSSANINAAENQTAVTTVTATDADGETPTFTLISGADQALFNLDSNTGVLTFKTAPDFENPTDANLDGTYEVVVLASDGVGGTDTQMINVTVTNINEGPDQNVQVDENTILVASMGAGDSDAPPYGIVGGADAALFQVSHNPVSRTFYLMFSAPPDFESPSDSNLDNVYEVTVNFNDVIYNYNVTVKDANDAPAGLPVITGTATEDQTLTADASGIDDEDGLGSFSYQWLRNGSAISGATAITYTLGDDDVGAQISVEVNYTDGRGTVETVTSAQTAAIAGINDAPVLSGSGMHLTTITEDAATNNGDLVSAIIASAGGDPITDADAGAVEGIAIFNLSNSNGRWDYDIGSGWTAVGSVSVNSSLLLRDTDRLRFVPNANWNGTELMSFAAWDQTSGTAGTKVDTSTYGGTTAFSTGTAIPSITVTAVNDDPTNTGSLPTDLVFLEDMQGKLNLSAIDLSDVDAGLGDLTLTITSANGHLQTMGWPGLTLGGSQSVLILTGNLTDLNDFLNDVNSIDYEHATPNMSGNNVDLITVEITDNGNSGSGGGGTIQIGTINIDITDVNPQLDLDADNSAASGNDFATTWTVGDGPVIITDSDLTITDLDSVNFAGCQVTLTNLPDGVNEVLGADTTGTSISANFDGFVLRLTGVDTIAHYEQVLRTVTYNNTAPSPDTTARVFTFEGYDSDANVSNIATSTLAIAAATNAAPVDLLATATTDGGISLNADGGNDVYFVADDGAGLLGGLTTVTIEASFSITTPGADLSPLLSYATGANDEELALFLKSDGRIWFGARSNGSPIQSTIGNYTQLFDGEVHHVGVSWDSSSGAVVFYVDGQQVESFAGYQTGQTIATGGELVFGQDQDSVLGGFKTIDVFSGSLYDVRIFNDVRTAVEIAGSYDQTLPNTESGMIANWTFNDLSTGGVITETVSGNNLTEQHVVGAGFSTSVAELTFRVPEDAVNGTVIGSLSAIDPDSGETFTYSLIDDAGGRFTINGSNGQITLANASLIDFESASSHNITARVTDSGALTYDEVFTVNILDVNDAPTIATNTGATFDEGSTGNIITTAMLNEGDPDDSGAGLTYTLTGDVSNGTLKLNGTALNVSDTFTQADIDAGLFTYDHDDSETSTDSFDFSLADGGEDGSTPAIGTFNLTITAVDDEAPVQTNNTGSSVTEGGTDTINNTELRYDDSEQGAANVTYTVTGGLANGQLELTTDPGMAVTFFTQNDIDNNWLVYVHDDSETTSDSFNFTVDDGQGNSVTGQYFAITVTPVNDAAPVATDDAYAVDEDNTLNVDWWDTDWNRRQQLTFDNLSQAETLTDFPVLVILNSSNIDYAQTKDDGSDLRFFAADGTQLAHEIEQWNEGGDSSVWVRVPQITGNSNSDSIWMYYGNAAAQPVTDATNVWDSNFVGVWHLNEEQGGTGTGGVYQDSTSHGNIGIDRVAATGQEGQVTDGQEFGANDWIEIAHDASLNLTDSITISFWIKPTSDSGNFNRVVEKGLWGYNSSYYFGGGNGTNDLTFYLNGQEVFDTADNVLTVGEWQQATVSYTSNGDGTGSARLHINGVEVDINGDPAGVAAPPIGTYNGGIVAGNTGRLAIGHENSSYDFDAFIDEVQISNTDRSADWIAAQYQATKNQFGVEFVKFGGEESAPAIGGVLSNDTDVDGDPLTVTLIDGPDNAQSFTLNKDGTFTYTPSADYYGSDTFTYEVNDGNGGTTQATATITVNPDNDAPTIEAAIADQNLAEDFASYTIDLNAAFADVETTDANLVYGVSGNTNINVSITAGIATITPTADWNGSETLTFSATDQGALSVSQDVVFAVSAQADIADDTAVSVTEDTPTVIAVLANDSFEGSPVVTATTAPANGAVVINGDNTITYTPNANYTGADSFTYTVTSGGVTETATVTVNVTADNDAPTIEAAIADQNLAEDFASYTIDLNAAFADVETTDANLVYGVSGNTNINVSITAGIATITPTADWNGSETLTFSATDQGALSVSQDVVFAVSAQADIADDTAVSVTEDTPTVIAVLANDSFEGSPVVTATTAPANGAVVINGDNTITYTPNANYTGADSFTYTVTSGGVTETATVTVNVTADNDAPTIEAAIADQNLAEDFASYTIDLNAAFADVETTDANLVYGVSGNTNINVSITAGIATITPTADWNGSETLTFSATDQGALSVSQDVVFAVSAQADIADDTAVSVTEDTPTVIAVLANDSFEGSPVVTATTAPANGAVVINGDNTITYTPNANYTGADSFTYTVTSGGVTETATVTVNVTADNDAPTIEAAIADQNLAEDFASYTIDLNAAFADVETTDANLVYGVSGNTNINVSITAGIATITPTADWNGSETLTFSATDQGALSVSQDVVFAVSAQADIADDTAVSVTEDTPTVIAVLANDSFEGSPVVTATTAPANGAVVINGDNTITYTPNANYTGADSFTYTVTSGGVTETATVTVNVTADNDAPTIEAAIADQNLAEDFASYTIDLNAAFADVETTDANLVYGVSGNTNINVSITAGIATITPTADWNGSETLTFSATDQGALSVSQDVVFAVSAQADIADDTAVSVTEDTPTVIAVLANDSFEGSPVVTATTAPANGAVVINGDNTITYTPNANYTGADSFTYTVTSGGVTETATVTVTVTADNDAPTIEAAIADQNLAEDFASYTIDLNAAFADVETTDANLVYGVSGNTNINVSITAGIATITPTADWNGSETLTFSATDQGALSVSQDVVFAVSAQADIADDTAVSVTEDTPTVIAVLANDSFEGSPVVTATTAPANGAVVINGDNTITYTPNANYTGADSFTYTVTSGGVTETATVTVNVTADNDAPTIEAAIADQNLAEDFASYTIDLNAAFADVETTDANLVYGVSGNTNINVSITAGIATITPTADWNGSETLTFSATDQGALSVSQDVVFAVSAQADIADDTAVSVTEDTPTVIAVLANDSFEGSPVVTATTAPANGAVVINGDNTITYTPNANYTGADSFTYTVTSGGVTETATVTVNVTADNDAPTIEAAIADQNLAEDFASYTIDLNAAFADVETTDANLVYGVSGNTNINVSITAGIATITPTADWNGSETLTFSATDQGALSVSQDVVFAVSAQADIADDTAVSVTEDTPTVIAVLANDSFEGSPVVTATTAPANGAVVINGDNTITYTPNANYTGADSFTYTVTSGGVTETATVTVNVTADNDAPTIEAAIADQNLAEDFASYTIDLNAAFADVETTDANLVYGVSGNTNINVSITAGIATITPTADWNGSETLTFSATDQGALSVSQDVVFAVSAQADIADDTAVSVTEDTPTVIAVLANDSFEGSPVVTATTAPANGAVVINGDNTITYTPNANYTGADSFTYTVTSGGVTETATVTVNVTADNDAPTIEAAIADQNLAEDFASYTIDLNAAFADVETTDANLVYGVSGNTNINVSITAGIATITPTADWNGSETLTFSATDQGALSVSQDVVFAVSAQADIADDTAVSVTEDTPTVIAVLANDSFEGSPVVTATTAPANGAVVINGDNTITYTPNANYTGADSFTYTVTSGGVTETATVTVNVTADNDAPTTTPVNLTAISEDGGNRLITQAELLANATDVDGPALTATNLAISAGSGTLVDNGDGTWNYTPAANDDTSVSFTYTVTDGSLTAAGSATLDITPVNDAPVTNNDSAAVDEGRNVVINLVGNDADVENALDLSSITITAAPTNGFLVDNGDGTLTYTHDGSKTISDSFSYTINDVSGATSNIAAVSLTVNPANDNDPADNSDTNPIILLLEDPVTDEDKDSDVESPTYEAPAEDSLTEDEVVSPVEAFQTPQDSGDADESIVQIKDPQDEESQEIIYLTDEIDRNTQSEERDDDRAYIYYDNDLYKDISFSKYLNLNGFAAENQPVAVSLDDVNILDFDSEDNDPVILDEDYDMLRQEIDESFNTELEGQSIKAKIVTVSAATFTVGIVSYLLRAGSLVASMMSALPLWRGFDPIAIFSGDKKKKKKKNEISDAGELKPEAFFDGDAE